MFDFIIFCVQQKAEAFPGTGSYLTYPRDAENPRKPDTADSLCTLSIPGNTYYRFSRESGPNYENARSADWGFLHQSKGCRYILLARNDELKGRLHIAKQDSDSQRLIRLPWMTEEEVSFSYCLSFPPECYESTENILRCLVNASPVGRLYVLIRCQSTEMPNIVGTLTVEEYMTLFRSGKIQANLCYIVSDKDKTPQVIYEDYANAELNRPPAAP
ncbi:MAG: hypothetical protein IJ449_04280 [Clostridia bacterium]|nr:hypothetical protein [Clostridia bacterium]